MDDIFKKSRKAPHDGGNKDKSKKKHKREEEEEDADRTLKGDKKDKSGKKKNKKVDKAREEEEVKFRQQDDENDNQQASNEEQEEEDDDSDAPIPQVDNSGPNPLLEVHRLWTQSAPADYAKIAQMSLPPARRVELLNALPTRAQKNYAWAIPDERALRIIHHFGPVVEIGAGKGYWGYALKAYAEKVLSNASPQARQIYISSGKTPDAIYTGYDRMPRLPRKEGADVEADGFEYGWNLVQKGSEEVLEHYKKHALLLCYPDEFEKEGDESLALACLQQFQGNIIITVGEHFGHTFFEDPWGRSAGSDFQQELASSFHKLIQVPLPSWPLSMDTLCVWKRSEYTPMEEEVEEDEEPMLMRHIPANEKLNLAVACPSMMQFLTTKFGDAKEKDGKSNTTTATSNATTTTTTSPAVNSKAAAATTAGTAANIVVPSFNGSFNGKGPVKPQQQQQSQSVEPKSQAEGTQKDKKKDKKDKKDKKEKK